jgi:hypothetical protein
MKKKRSTILIVFIIGLAFGLGLAWRWVQETPYYSLYQIGAALKNRDPHTFFRYVDLEALLKQQASGSFSSLLSSLTPAGSLGKLAGPLGDIKIQLTPEVNRGLSTLVSRQIRDYLENPNNPTLPSSFLLLSVAQVKVKEDTALVDLKHNKDQLRLGMKKQEGVWRVVELNPEDTQKLIKTYLLPAAPK